MPDYSVVAINGETVNFSYPEDIPLNVQRQIADDLVTSIPAEIESAGDAFTGLAALFDGNMLAAGSISYTLAVVIGFGLYKLITVKDAAASPTDYGRVWMAWMVFIISLTPLTLPKYFQHFDVNGLAAWVIGIVVYGALAFVLGWFYGKLFGNKHEKMNDPTLSMTSKKEPVSFGLKWMFVAVVLGIWASFLTFYFRNISVPAAIMNGIITTLMLGATAFVLGWLYGKFFGKQGDTQKSTEPSPAPSSTQELTASQNIEPPSTSTPSGSSLIQESTELQNNEPISTGPTSSVADEEVWAQALNEFEGDSRRPGLWAKSFADADGDEAVAKAAYLRQRVSELQQEHTDKEAEIRREELGNANKLRYEQLDNEIKQALELMNVSFDGKHYHYSGNQYDHRRETVALAINVYDEKGFTPLMRAAREGNVNLVRILVSEGADPNLKADQFGRITALSMATAILNRTKDKDVRATYQAIIDILKPISF